MKTTSVATLAALLMACGAKTGLDVAERDGAVPPIPCDAGPPVAPPTSCKDIALGEPVELTTTGVEDTIIHEMHAVAHLRGAVVVYEFVDQIENEDQVRTVTVDARGSPLEETNILAELPSGVVGSIREPGVALDGCDVYALASLSAGSRHDERTTTCRLSRVTEPVWDIEVDRGASCFDLRRDGDVLSWVEGDAADPAGFTRLGRARTDGRVLDEVPLEGPIGLALGQDARVPMSSGGFAILSRAGDDVLIIRYDAEARETGRSLGGIRLDSPFDRIATLDGPGARYVFWSASRAQTIHVAPWDATRGEIGTTTDLEVPPELETLVTAWRPVFVGAWLMPLRRPADELAFLGVFETDGSFREALPLDSVTDGDAELVVTNDGALLFHVETRFRPPLRELIEDVIFARPVRCGS